MLSLAPHVAAFQVAVFPLSRKLSEPSKKIEIALRRDFTTDFDTVGSIGKRYRRHDEIGTPFCVTYDFDSETDHKVTVRNRDTMEQDRIEIEQVSAYLQDKFRAMES